MSTTSRLFAGAAAAGPGARGGLYRKEAAGRGWKRLDGGLPDDTQVQAITIHPANADLVYIGTHRGPYRSVDGGDHWERLGFPDDGTQVWSVLVHAADPRVLYAGTAPVGVYRSEDGGDSWRRQRTDAMPARVRMEFPCRVMRLAADPAHPDELYAILEVGGVMRSRDAGESWQDCCAGLLKLAERPHLKSMIQSDTETEGMLDGHALCVSGARERTVFIAVRMGLFRSEDGGMTWDDMEVGRFSPLTYSRDVRVSPQDARVLYACLSPAARSQEGALYRSDDLGASWARFDNGIKAEATMMAVALHPSDAAQVHCASRSGQVFSTLDGGSTWTEDRLPDGVRDVYALACA